MTQKEFEHAAQPDSVTAVEVQHAINLLAREGYVLDAQAYESARRGQTLFQEITKDTGFESSDAPGYTFFYRKGDQHVALEWDNEAGTACISTHEGDIGSVATSHEYTVRQFLKEWPPGAAPQTSKTDTPKHGQ